MFSMPGTVCNFMGCVGLCIVPDRNGADSIGLHRKASEGSGLYRIGMAWLRTHTRGGERNGQDGIGMEWKGRDWRGKVWSYIKGKDRRGQERKGAERRGLARHGFLRPYISGLDRRVADWKRRDRKGAVMALYQWRVEEGSELQWSGLERIDMDGKGQYWRGMEMSGMANFNQQRNNGERQ